MDSLWSIISTKSSNSLLNSTNFNDLTKASNLIFVKKGNFALSRKAEGISFRSTNPIDVYACGIFSQVYPFFLMAEDFVQGRALGVPECLHTIYRDIYHYYVNNAHYSSSSPMDCLTHEYYFDEMRMRLDICHHELTNSPNDPLPNGGGGTGNGSGSGSSGSAGYFDTSVFFKHIDDTLAPLCIKSIIRNLETLDVQNNPAADILKKFAADSPGFNLKIVPQEGQNYFQFGYTLDNISTDGYVHLYINTNPLAISYASDLAIAATLIHEAIHGHFIALYRSDPEAATLAYPQLFEKYSKKKALNNGQIQHNVMSILFVQDIAATLKHYGEQRGYVLDEIVI